MPSLPYHIPWTPFLSSALSGEKRELRRQDLRRTKGRHESIRFVYCEFFLSYIQSSNYKTDTQIWRFTAHVALYLSQRERREPSLQKTTQIYYNKVTLKVLIDHQSKKTISKHHRGQTKRREEKRHKEQQQIQIQTQLPRPPHHAWGAYLVTVLGGRKLGVENGPDIQAQQDQRRRCQHHLPARDSLPLCIGPCRARASKKTPPYDSEHPNQARSQRTGSEWDKSAVTRMYGMLPALRVYTVYTCTRYFEYMGQKCIKGGTRLAYATRFDTTVASHEQLFLSYIGTIQQYSNTQGTTKTARYRHRCHRPQGRKGNWIGPGNPSGISNTSRCNNNFSQPGDNAAADSILHVRMCTALRNTAFIVDLYLTTLLLKCRKQPYTAGDYSCNDVLQDSSPFCL